MATYTDLGLKKPDSTDFFNVSDLNDNMDTANTLFNERVKKDSVVNNLLTTEEGFVADARALKTLNDRITELISKKPYGCYINNDVTTGAADVPKPTTDVITALFDSSVYLTINITDPDTLANQFVTAGFYINDINTATVFTQLETAPGARLKISGSIIVNVHAGDVIKPYALMSSQTRAINIEASAIFISH